MILPKNIQAWVDALRSGKFSQQKGTLKSPSGYCCLGVYCSIMGKEPAATELDEYGSPFCEGDDDLYRFCRKEIDVDVVEVGITMNDNGQPFEEIADMIEERYSKLGKE